MNIYEMKNLCYGGDYNPEQWINYPGVWDEDIRLLKLAKINCVSLGIFAWAAIEKEEGVFDFSWMDEIIEKLHKNDIKIILATPSASRPQWLSEKYPEVLRVSDIRTRNLYGRRHNHCQTSPVYREKTEIINTKLSERYGNHPSVIMWHISNEFSGECHCPLCQNEFRNWLKAKYNNSLDELNHAWWATFWSHTYTDWSQIESPSPIGESSVHGLKLDWQRFVSDQTIDFMKHEISAVRKFSNLPTTANLMDYEGLDYFKLAKHIDCVSWDNYPKWHSDSMIKTANSASFLHDLFRCMKQKPFLMIESTPSLVNWHDVNKLKAPGVNILSSLQAVAHGSDGVMYFQIRKSRGSSEKFHGAVIDHNASENTRVFKEVQELGKILSDNSSVKGTVTRSSVAVIYDYENSWAIDGLQGLKRDRKYRETCINHYSAMRNYGINVDVIEKDADFSDYKVIVAPMLYMVSEATANKIKAYVSSGGIFVGTYLLSYVNETDLCHLGGFPGHLKDVFGIRNEEIDTLYNENALLVGDREYQINDYCEIIYPDDDTEVLGTYKDDFYKNTPALTKHKFGAGTAYYIAARTCDDFLYDFYSDIFMYNGIVSLVTKKDENVSVTKRGDKLFIMNFSDEEKNIEMSNEKISLKPYETIIK